MSRLAIKPCIGILSLLVIPFLSALSPCVHATPAPPDDDSLTFVSKWKENLRYSFDFSSRGARDRSGNFVMSVAGFDMHKVFSTRNRDVGTLTFQPYLVYISDRDRAPYYFDDEKTALTWRIANFNWYILPNGLLNIRAGHFEVPFGLEQDVDTNGTLRQYSFSHRGVKADWGVSVNGIAQDFEYEFAITRGTGNEYSELYDPYIVSGRLGMNLNHSTNVGVSVFDGRVQGAQGATEQQHLGLDYSYFIYSFEFLSELSIGKIEDDASHLALFEFGWRNTTSTVHAYCQWKNEHVDTEEEIEKREWALGLQLLPSRRWDLSTQASLQTKSETNKKKGYAYTMQLRYRI